MLPQEVVTGIQAWACSLPRGILAVATLQTAGGATCRSGGDGMHKDLCLNKNLGTTDRAIRAAVGAVLLAYPVLASWPSWWIATLSAIGGTQFIAATTGY